MTQSQHTSTYLTRLHAIQATDTTGAYIKAQSELEKQVALHPGRKTFYVCSKESEEVRRYIAGRFREDGLEAEVYENYHFYYDGEEVTEYCVRVTIPDRS